MAPPDLVIFSDLDGCLLDAETYDFEAASPALALVRAREIPLVFCSSKTQAEVEIHRDELGLADPFVVENGGAVLIPRGYFPSLPPGAEPAGAYARLSLGVPYARVTGALREVEAAVGLRLRGFSEMSPEEVARRTGLRIEAARRAKARQYDEPFVADLDPAQERWAEEEARRRGLALTCGGRFYHLSGPHSKGTAVELLTRLFRAHRAQVTTAALGDGANDRSMLQAVDLPVIIPRAPGRVDPALEGLGARVAPAPGPAGWAAAVAQLLAAPGRWSP